MLSCGCPVAVVRQALEKNPEKWVLQGDFFNVFNLVNCETIFREVE